MSVLNTTLSTSAVSALNPIFSSLAAQFGTPLYVYEEAIILRRLALLRQHIGAEIRFAVKANSNIHILRLLHQHGCGFDVVSGGELERVLAAGGDPATIVFSGVGKTDSEIVLAIEKNIQAINVESEQELDVINELAVARATSARVAIRINPALDAQTHPHLTTGNAHSKFGIPAERAAAIADRITQKLKAIKLVGLACHIGSQIVDAEVLISAYQALIGCANALNHPLEFVDFGGGFGVAYSEDAREIDLAAIGLAIKTLAHARRCLIEPGRFIVAPAGTLLSKVLYSKTAADGHKIVIVDAGMNDNMRPALYGAAHPIKVCSSESRIESVDVVGPVCESACVFARNYQLATVKRGDIIAIQLSGAYTASMSSNYNSRPLAAELLIKIDGSVQLIRARQTTTEMWQNEVLT